MGVRRKHLIAYGEIGRIKLKSYQAKRLDNYFISIKDMENSRWTIVCLKKIIKNIKKKNESEWGSNFIRRWE